ncbi:MAG: MerR family transcriptional regulator [Vulcanimicrobiaceae bacterium]
MLTMDVLQAKEFAERAGVTVRTLHHYDKLGLLVPHGRTASGYRLYLDADLVRLQQITALRFVGFSLKAIKELLDQRDLSLRDALQLQRDILLQRRAHLDRALQAVEAARSQVQRGTADEVWRALRNIIEAMNVENDWDWVKAHYSPAQLERLAARDDPSKHQEWQDQWATLIAEVEAAKDDDPASQRAQALAQRWQALVFAFTNGEPDIEHSLGNVYRDKSAQPSGFKPMWSGPAGKFIGDAIAVWKERNPR